MVRKWKWSLLTLSRPDATAPKHFNAQRAPAVTAPPWLRVALLLEIPKEPFLRFSGPLVRDLRLAQQVRGPVSGFCKALLRMFMFYPSSY